MLRWYVLVTWGSQGVQDRREKPITKRRLKHDLLWLQSNLTWWMMRKSFIESVAGTTCCASYTCLAMSGTKQLKSLRSTIESTWRTRTMRWPNISNQLETLTWPSSTTSRVAPTRLKSLVCWQNSIWLTDYNSSSLAKGSLSYSNGGPSTWKPKVWSKKLWIFTEKPKTLEAVSDYFVMLETSKMLQKSLWTHQTHKRAST